SHSTHSDREEPVRRRPACRPRQSPFLSPPSLHPRAEEGEIQSWYPVPAPTRLQVDRSCTQLHRGRLTLPLGLAPAPALAVSPCGNRERAGSMQNPPPKTL